MFYSEYALAPYISAEDQEGFVAKVTAHFYVPPTKVGLRSLEACVEVSFLLLYILPLAFFPFCALSPFFPVTR